VFDVGTAGSVTLVLQAVLPVALAAPDASTFHIIGGTDVKAAPPFDYFRYVSCRCCSVLASISASHSCAGGYYPRGGGEVEGARAARPARAVGAGFTGALQELAEVSHTSPICRRTSVRAHEGYNGRTDLWAEYGTARIELQRLGHARPSAAGGAIVLWARHANTWLGGSEVAQRGIPRRTHCGPNSPRTHCRQNLRAAAITIDVARCRPLLILSCPYRRPAHFTRPRLQFTRANHRLLLIEQFLPVRVTARAGGCRPRRIAVTPC